MHAISAVDKEVAAALLQTGTKEGITLLTATTSSRQPYNSAAMPLVLYVATCSMV